MDRALQQAIDWPHNLFATSTSGELMHRILMGSLGLLMVMLGLAPTSSTQFVEPAAAASALDIGPGPYEIPDRPLTTEAVRGIGKESSLGPNSFQMLREHSGLSGSALQEALLDHAVTVDAGTLAGLLSVRYPDIFVTHARRQDGSGYDFVFTAEPPAAVTELVETLSSDSNILYGASMSATQLIGAQQEILKYLDERLAAVGSSARGVNLVTSPHSTALGVFLPAHSLPDSDEDLAGELTAILASSSPTIYVKTRTDDLRNTEFANLRGGRGYSGCTSGFGAVRNVRGLLTANHCSDRPYYETTGIQMGDQVGAGAQTDIQFNPKPDPHTVDRGFQADWGTDYVVEGVVNPGYGDGVSKFGVATGRSGGTVTNANTCYTGSGNTWCNVFLFTGTGNGGDSGGPCFTWGTARGIVSGGTPGVHTYCTRISSLPSNTSVLVQ